MNYKFWRKKVVEILTILDAIENGMINIEVTSTANKPGGTGFELTQEVCVKAIRTKKNKIKVVIPAGTFFANANRKSFWDMIAIEDVVLDLSERNKTAKYVPTAILNSKGGIPLESQSFDVVSLNSDDLNRLIQVIRVKKLSNTVARMAISIVADDISRWELDHTFVNYLGYLRTGPSASNMDVFEIRQILEEAGIDIQKKRIFDEKSH